METRKKQERVYNKKTVTTNKKSILNSFFTSMLKLNLAIALKNKFFRAQKCSEIKGFPAHQNFLKKFSVFTISLALLFMLAFVVSAGDVIIEAGTLDVDSKLVVTAAGNVGIGTISPSEKLVVIGNVELENNGEVFLNLKNTEVDGGQYSLISAGSLGGIGVGKFSIYDKTVGISRLTIDAAGNVGIGTTSPGEKLTVIGNIKISSGGNTNLLVETTAVSNAGVLIAMDNPAQSAGSASNSIVFQESGVTKASINYRLNEEDFAIRTGGGGTDKIRMTIDSSGNVGIGTATPAYLLEIVATGDHFALKHPNDATNSLMRKDSDGTFAIFSAGSNAKRDMKFNTGGLAADEVLRLTSSGNVGIGTTNPAQKLDVTGQIHSTGDICTDVGGGYCLSTGGGGGAATDVSCTNCVTLGTETTGGYAGSGTEGGAASDLACSNCVSSAEVQFNYAGSGSEGGKANDANLLDGIDSSSFCRSNGANCPSAGATINIRSCTSTSSDGLTFDTTCNLCNSNEAFLGYQSCVDSLQWCMKNAPTRTRTITLNEINRVDDVNDYTLRIISPVTGGGCVSDFPLKVYSTTCKIVCMPV